MARTETMSFAKLPNNVDELKALPEAAMSTPFQTAALVVATICRYKDSREDCIAMLNFLRGPRPMMPYDIQFLRDRLGDKEYLPPSYFAGSSPQNNYVPTVPYTVTVFDDTYSYVEENYARLYIRSSGADSPRPIKLRRKGDQWFLWENYLLPDIRKPAAQDPWA